MNSILTPVLALIVLTLVVWIWMYVTRIPAMAKAKVQPQDARFPGSLDRLPDAVRRSLLRERRRVHEWRLRLSFELFGHV